VNEQIQKKSAATTLKNVINLSGRNPIAPFFGPNPLSTLVELFVQEPHLHRVALFTGSGQFVRPCSKTDVIKFLYDHSKDSPTIVAALSKHIETVLDQKSGVTKVSVKTAVKDVLEKLSIANGLAVIDEQGKLVGQMEISSLRGLYESDFNCLSLPVGEYLQRYHQEGLEISTVDLNTSIADVLQQFVKSKAHRLWILDDDHKPTHVVEQTDVLRVASSGDRVSEREISGGIKELWHAFRTMDLGSPASAPGSALAAAGDDDD